MKWKRSKKAQQEAKEKKSSSSSSSSSSSASLSVSSSAASNGGSMSSVTNSATLPSNNSGHEQFTTTKTTDKLSENNLLINTHTNGFNMQKSIPNADQHRHIVNLSSANLSDYSNLEESMIGGKLNRRPLLFNDGNQNGEMFRPYVV